MKMANFNLCRRLFTVQLIFLTVSIILVDVDGLPSFRNIMKGCQTVARSFARVPSKLADGGQYVTQKVAGSVGNAVQPLGPLKQVVDMAGGAMSNVIGSTSRLLGKTVGPPQHVMFLYRRPLMHLGNSRTYQEAVKAVIGLALMNVVMHADEMDGQAGDMSTTPVLRSVLTELGRAGATRDDIAVIVKTLGRNGKHDLPDQIRVQALGILKDQEDKFRTNGPIEELRWIAQNPKGFYMMDDKERTDYKLKTQTEYTSCTVILPPISDEKNE